MANSSPLSPLIETKIYKHLSHGDSLALNVLHCVSCSADSEIPPYSSNPDSSPYIYIYTHTHTRTHTHVHPKADGRPTSTPYRQPSALQHRAPMQTLQLRRGLQFSSTLLYYIILYYNIKLCYIVLYYNMICYVIILYCTRVLG